MSCDFVQAQVDALELEKDSLGQQIDSMMVDRQNLLQVKMSLGLEVATYRYMSMSSRSSSTPKHTTFPYYYHLKNHLYMKSNMHVALEKTSHFLPNGMPEWKGSPMHCGICSLWRPNYYDHASVALKSIWGTLRGVTLDQWIRIDPLHFPPGTDPDPSAWRRGRETGGWVIHSKTSFRSVRFMSVEGGQKYILTPF